METGGALGTEELSVPGEATLCKAMQAEACSGDRRLLSYVLALVIGLAMLATLMPGAAIVGTGGIWSAPGGDVAQGLTGHLALQMDAWRFPPLVTRALFWPKGLSVAMTDSNPLMSLLAKSWHTLTGRVVNLLGVWFALCWVLQPVAAVYALRGMGRFGPVPCAAAAMLAALAPALLYRIGHINLCGHFLILAALGLVCRAARRPEEPVWARAGVLLTVMVLCHPYLYLIGAALLLSLPAQHLLERDFRALKKTTLPGLIVLLVPVGVYRALSGTLGGGDGGFGTFSMNLLSPVWPQRSGVFGPERPILDATGGQYEGFNYLGACILLLLAVALAGQAWRPTAVHARLGRFQGLAGVLLLLTGFALSSRVYAGHHLLVSLGDMPWKRLFGMARSSGRFFWPVGYALMLFGVASAARLRQGIAVPLLAVAVLLQYADARPLLRWVRQVMAGETAATDPLPVLPPGARLVTVLPPLECSSAALAQRQDARLLLAALRAGARLGDAAVARQPRWTNCERMLTDALELPLAPGEARVFNDPAVLSLLRPGLLGAGAVCGGQGGTVICARGAGAVAGRPVTAEPEIPAVTLPAYGLTGMWLAPYLAHGWTFGADGTAWSNGLRSTILARVPPGRGVVLNLTLRGVPPRREGRQWVTVLAGARPLMRLTLEAKRASVVSVPFAPAETGEGVVRIALDVEGPVDPGAVGIAAPVGQTALHLLSLDVAEAAGGAG
jgi:Family of unknown function (DUF6311)